VIRNPHILRAFEDDLARRTPVDFRQNLLVVEAMLAEARLLGAWPASEPLAGVEVDIRVARILNVRRTT
jgi:hypothetical protein